MSCLTQRLIDELALLQRLRTGAVQSVPRSVEGEMQQLMRIYQGLAPRPAVSQFGHSGVEALAGLFEPPANPQGVTPGSTVTHSMTDLKVDREAV